MSVNQATFPIATMARVLGVSEAGFHAWRKRPPSKKQEAGHDAVETRAHHPCQLGVKHTGRRACMRSFGQEEKNMAASALHD